MDLKVQSLKNRANNAHVVINHLFQHPMIDAQMVKLLQNYLYRQYINY